MPQLPGKKSNLPLYNGARWHSERDIVAPLEGQNFGLVWERYFDGYTENFDSFIDIKEGRCRQTNKITQQEQHGKADFVLGFGKKTIEITSDLPKRQSELINAMGGITHIYKLDWHFVTGMGNEHPTENGFTWHRTLGTPYLPGSSVKGLLRGYLEWLYEIKPNEPTPADVADVFSRWFGSPHKNPSQWPDNTDSRAGWFVFFDALPIAKVELAADVMTPHMGDWYEKGGKIDSVNGEPNPAIVPADWHSPNPVVFLVVKHASFQFGVAVRENLKESEQAQAKEDLPLVMEKLQEALQWIGAGAKTAVGYGRMSPDEKANKAAEKMRREAAMVSMGPRERLTAIIADWSEAELARRFGKDSNSTREEFGEEFDLLQGLVCELRRDDIAQWESATKKTDKLRWKAFRKLTGQAGEE